MKAIKKIEIVTGSLDAKKVINLLDEKGIKGYTIIKNVMGNGDKGYQDGDGLHEAFQNKYIMVACSEEELEKLVEPLRAILKKSGGICLVSDAQWLVH
ncbi:MAG: transcriptional regulator [Bacteroidota bacterium]